jgi:hypothetical protein
MWKGRVKKKDKYEKDKKKEKKRITDPYMYQNLEAILLF